MCSAPGVRSLCYIDADQCAAASQVLVLSINHTLLPKKLHVLSKIEYARNVVRVHPLAVAERDFLPYTRGPSDSFTNFRGTVQRVSIKCPQPSYF